MKKTIIFILIALMFVVGCEEQAEVSEEVECTSDTDCITGGCSGTVCQPASAPPVFTTCEYKEEYACYKMINCGCVEGKCSWQKTPEFEQCVAAAQ